MVFFWSGNGTTGVAGTGVCIGGGFGTGVVAVSVALFGVIGGGVGTGVTEAL